MLESLQRKYRNRLFIVLEKRIFVDQRTGTDEINMFRYFRRGYDEDNSRF